jgi:hypothetical protein
VIIRHGLRLYYVSNGQRVPEDLHLPNRPYLLHRAFKDLPESSPHRLAGVEPGLMMATSAAGCSRPEASVADFRGDQAAGLRRLLGRPQLRIVTFAAGSTGVGKSVRWPIWRRALAAQGREVLVVDENTPTNGIAAFFGAFAANDLQQVIDREKSLAEVLLRWRRESVSCRRPRRQAARQAERCRAAHPARLPGEIRHRPTSFWSTPRLIIRSVSRRSVLPRTRP